MAPDVKRSLALTLAMIFACSHLCFAKVVKQYYPNGKLYAVQVYYDEGGIKGPFKMYWPNGKLRQKIWYKNGLPILMHLWSDKGVRLK